MYEHSTSFDCFLFTMIVSHILADIILIVGAIKKSPALTIPWIGLSIFAFAYVMVSWAKTKKVEMSAPTLHGYKFKKICYETQWKELFVCSLMYY